jgi:putative transposase
MSRIARKNIVSKFVHIVAKGIKSEFIFYKQEYKEKYTFLLNKCIKELEGIDLIAYCVMDNHAHLLIHTKEINKVETLMRKINTAYAIFYNLQEERSGYVFFNRYHSEMIENGIHLLSCIKYIHENPVKAGIVEKAHFYQYSSCKDFLEDKMRNDILCSIFGENFKYASTDVDKRIEYHFIDEDERLEKVERQSVEIIIEEFCNKYNTSIAEIRKSNSLILEFKKFLKVKYKISNKNICAILGIGKNRISVIEKKLK